MLASFWAAEGGDIPAVISDAGTRTRAEANANANRLVRALRVRGVKPGDGIALMCSNRPEFFEVVAAAKRAGLRLTTVNWHLTGDEAGYIVDDCEATTFVADARFAHVVRRAADLAPRVRALVAVGGAIDGFEEWD
ncbi:MAG: long-chain acyl-CoA synthetase, partial [Actinomycetota bacterium]|nr:long-chain acyl-CoA synthetase [Actinomycetota bacterium]